MATVDTPTLPREEIQARRVAGWIYQNKDKPDWWTHLALTSANNTDPTAPRLSDSDSYSVFSLLESRGFMVRIALFPVSKTENIPVFAINPEKIREFKVFADLPFLYRVLPHWIFNLFSKFKTLFIGALILIVTSFFTSLFEKFGEALGEYLTKLIQSK